MSATSSIAVLLVVFLAAGNAVPYSKYGRNCKDIGCRSDETCVMEEDPCDGSQRDSCGRYPTCRRSTGGGESCTTKLCPSGTYCRTNNGVPTCVNTNPSLAPAARRPPGYQRPQVTPRPVVPTPPPRSSSYDNRYSGQSGNHNTIGGNSIWNRLFGGNGGNSGGSARYGGSGDSSRFGGSSRSGGSSGLRGFDRPTSKPSTSNGGKDYYKTHTATDSKGNRVWTFSG